MPEIELIPAWIGAQFQKLTRENKSESPQPGEERLVRVGCPAHNCGGRCLLIAHVRAGVITRLEADDRPDRISAPQLRCCPRGAAYLRRQYHPDRLLYPQKRVGKRGAGEFTRISWEEALDAIASEMLRIKEEYGSGAFFVPYGTGSYSQLNGSQTARRLLNLFGGSLGFYGNYSWAAIQAATPTVYGTQSTGSQRQDWLNARYILMWGWNPAEMRDDTNSDYLLHLARRNGAKLVCIDPRLTLSAQLADEWIPIRPGTDAAMLSAMAFVMIQENLYDAGFVESHCVGFDSSQMPPGLENAESYCDYILGVSDGIPKTPEWAAAITGVPSETITRIAREYATIKPGMLYQGYGMQRRAYGEQVVRAGCALAALTGNVGIRGGWASGTAIPVGEDEAENGGSILNLFPTGENPFRTKIPVFLWTEAVLRGSEMGLADGLRDGDHLDSNIKMIYAVASNCLVNQHANIQRTAQILQDESKVELVVVQDNFLTPTGRFADILLPACTQFETWGFEDGWKFNEEVLLMPKLVEPPGEAKSDFRICADIAARLGIGEQYTEGRDERGWTAWLIEILRQTRFPDIPSLDEFEAANIGYYGKPVENPSVAFAKFRSDPQKHPLKTPSGKIEIFSERLHSLERPADIPAVPKYIQEWESPFGPEARQYPLQAIGHHTLHRVHSTHDNNDWLEEAFPQRLAINPLDAQMRGISDGDLVRVYNARGAILLPSRVTKRIMPGVVDIPQGAWWKPGKDGVDTGGSINLLTSEQWTPFAFGNTQHTIMVQAEKYQGQNDLPQNSMQAGKKLFPRQPELAEAKKTGQMAFYFDASACTGCKTCQTICKNRNSLPVGILWRRVYEVAGGDWRRNADTWNQDVFAFNLSIACNHCEDAICVQVCPTGAIKKRQDGIVLIDSSRCIGCKYCSWACPYDALQYNEASGTMTKCTFCVEEIDQGKPPACVAACPMRALDFGDKQALIEKYGLPVDGTGFPLPNPELTKPALLIKPHREQCRAETGPARVANREEV